MTDNKQKIIEILISLANGNWLTMADYREIAEKIDALYHRDCGKCKYYKRLDEAGNKQVYETCGVYCKHNTSDYYEEATE